MIRVTLIIGALISLVLLVGSRAATSRRTDLDRGADFSPRLCHILRSRGLKSAPLFFRVIPQAPNTARVHFHLWGAGAKS